MNKIKLIILVNFCFMFSSTLNAQFCFDSYTNEDCPYRIVSEFAVSTQLNPLYDQDSKLDFALNLGIQKRIKGDFSMGIHWFSNLVIDGDKSSFQMGLRTRLAHKLSQDIEVSVSPGVILTNSIDGLSKFKGLSIESNLSWKNQVGIVVRIDNHNTIMREDETVINLGLQTYGSASFYSVGGVFLGGGLLVLLLGGIGLN